MLTFNIAILLLLTMCVFLKCLYFDIPVFSLFTVSYSLYCQFDQLIYVQYCYRNCTSNMLAVTSTALRQDVLPLTQQHPPDDSNTTLTLMTAAPY